MTHCSLDGCLANLSIRTAKEQIQLWNKQKQSYSLAKSLSIEQTQAKKLVDLNLDHNSLKDIRAEYQSETPFKDYLKKKGVNMQQALAAKIIRITRISQV